MHPILILDAKATLGEGPAWDSKTQSLYWLDILEKRIYCGTQILAELDDLVGCLAPCENGNLILGKRSAFVEFQPGSSRQTILAALSEPVVNRFNDGKCDPAGRFIAGTMNMNETDPTGTVYSFDGKQATPLLRGMTISNGLAWNPDHNTFYHIDTPTREVKAYDYDIATGQISNPRTAIYVPDSLGWPDGMTSDTDGNLWIALWGGAQVTKWNPETGQLIDQIPVPALQTSSCVFGGRDLNELYVTSARKGMSQSALIKYPLSGGLFKIGTKATGLTTFEFG
jgi:sugar lactone lactonase YvrE